MLTPLLLLCPFVPGQDLEPTPPSPWDRVVEIALDAGDEPLEESGHAEWVEYEAQFTGTLHVWARSSGDLSLLVEGEDGELVGEDRDSGGGTTPYLALEVQRGDTLWIVVSDGEPLATGAASLHLVAAPETQATREAAESALRAAQVVEAHLEAGELERARPMIAAAVEELQRVEGGAWSEALAGVSRTLAYAAHRASLPATIRRALTITVAHRARTLPPDHIDLLTARQNLAITMGQLGDLHAAREIEEALLESFARCFPAQHPNVLGARQNLAITMRSLGDIEGAHAHFEAILEVREQTLPEDHPQRLTAMRNLAVTTAELGDLAGARALEEAAVETLARVLPEDHPDLLGLKQNLGNTLRQLGDLDGALALQEEVLEEYERTLPDVHHLLLGARQNLAITLRELGDLPGARAIEELVVEALERSLPADHPSLLTARQNLAATLSAIGELDEARAILESLYEIRGRTRAAEHPDLLSVRQALAATLLQLQEVAEARAHLEALNEILERTLPEDHPNLLGVRQNLALAMAREGEQRAARTLFEDVLTILEQALPADHPDILRVRLNLADTVRNLGRLSEARAIAEAVLEARERTLPQDHPDVTAARQNLANTLLLSGDLLGARTLFERVLATHEQALPAYHPDLIGARANLGNVKLSLGDPAGARTLYEAVVETLEGRVDEDHPDLLATRQSLGVAMWQMGELAAARVLFESVVGALESRLSEDHPRLLMARQNLAVTLSEMGDLAGARELEEAVLALRELSLPPDHPELLKTRENLGVTLLELGELAQARALTEAVFEARERILPIDHFDRLRARKNLALTHMQSGDLAAARELLPGLVSGMLARASSAAQLSPREARELIESGNHMLGLAIFLSRSSDGAEQEALFELIETRRAVATEALRTAALAARDRELHETWEEVRSARSALSDLVSSGAYGEVSGEEYRARIDEASSRRDRAEQAIRVALVERGIGLPRLSLAELAPVLPPKAALVGFLRFEGRELDPESGGTRLGEDHLLAHVVSADGALSCVDLGPASELESLVADWRAAVGSAIGRGVSVQSSEPSEVRERRAGKVLRERLIDPLRRVAGPAVDTLHLCPDDLVCLLPLDALPAGEERLGDRMQIVLHSSFARLAAPLPELESAPALLALGNPAYDGEGASGDTIVAVAAPIAPDARGGALTNPFTPLYQTGPEIEAVCGLFERTLSVEPSLLTEDAATKAALVEAATGKRFLHLATHGWFAPDTVRAIDGEPSARAGGRPWAPMGAEQRTLGLAPSTLCGLALAGANRGVSSLGRVPGIMTAEELATLDLSSCELAVLSACETNVGLSRSGQGIQSLQTALHAAGARAAITSLWKVDDAATRGLMERFYGYLWGEGLPVADALWRAKTDLRRNGHPLFAWAGWVLSER